MFTPCILQENGSQLPDINPFSNFADLVSDMPGKSKVLKRKKKHVFSETDCVYACYAVTSGKTTRNYC